MDGCEHRDKCPFYAPRFYLEHPKAVEDGLVYAVTDQADSVTRPGGVKERSLWEMCVPF